MTLLAERYGRPLLVRQLGISPERLTHLESSGLADERLFDQLTFLDELGGILFAQHPKRLVRRWLLTVHPSLGGKAPISALQEQPRLSEESKKMLLQLAHDFADARLGHF
ncbi:hypothetical protein [Deinococcus humi]|uniref:Antitoxin Xre/MbcA/ParS-like toxin-binding domain-containing protein n=1 Tax=Deinococcus humi TaxID=662880 RepID=A0A7W8NHY9_9DEIO|nr:hypothetical protein [Deinococcus humi]MBB5364517.1 hypothetical protein [Deinococcus humi]